MPSRDYYDILGVKKSASADEIRSAYRKLARELHPDVNKAADAAKKFAEVQAAYEVLSDEQKKQNYDRFGVAEPGFGGAGPGGAGGGRRYTWTNVGGRPGAGPGGGQNVDFGDFDAGSIFDEIFGASRGGDAGGSNPFAGFGARAKARSKPTRGGDLNHDLVVDFLEAARGGTKSVRITRGGSSQTIEVTLPVGVAEGTKLRVRGAGSPSASGGPPGDLILTVHIGPHEWFRRDGLDVLVDVPLTIAEAALGATVHVPTLTGKAEVSVPAGTSSGARLRLRGQGIRTHEKGHGDLYAVIKIVAPKDLSEADKAALRDMGARLGNPRAW